MDRFRLKNIIILILLLLNGFLLFSLGQRRTMQRNAYHRTVEQLVDLFQEDGMELDPGAISQDTPPSGVTLARDTALEEQAAAFLLGGETLSSSDQGGGIFHYAGAAGEALFRSSGAFEASGTLAAGERIEDFCRDFCRTFSYDAPDIRLDGEGNGVFTAQGVYGKLPVFNCAVSFTVENQVLAAVSGTLLPKTGAAAAGEEPLSASGALLAFQRMRRESAAVVSTVTDTRLCYELQTAGASMSLTPAWRIVTDTEDYYVNCQSGAVTAGGARTGEG